ncbi:MAG: hypothetical protein ACJATU_000316 [Rickettsiales bacterium]
MHENNFFGFVNFQYQTTGGNALMKLGEDFGYLKDEEQNRLGTIAKKALLLGAVVFSIVCFIYITINAYYFVYHDEENGIRLIKSSEEPIKIIAKNDGKNIKNIDKTIYDSIVGNSKLVRDDLDNVKIVRKAKTPKANKDLKAVRINEIPPANKSKTSSAKNKTIMIYETGDAKTKINESLVSGAKKLQIKNNISNQKLLKGLSRVQLVALTSRESAIRYWSKLNKNHPVLFTKLNHFISEVSLGSKGTFYRLQIGNFRNQVDAEEFCRKFILQAKKTKSDCIIVE